MGEYAAIARKKDSVWYVGAMNNWDARQLTLHFSFLADGQYEAEIFKDGVNADRQASDYKREVVKVSKGDTMTISMSEMLQ